MTLKLNLIFFFYNYFSIIYKIMFLVKNLTFNQFSVAHFILILFEIIRPQIYYRT